MISLKFQHGKSVLFPLIAGSLHWLATFFLERRILIVSPAEHLLDYCLCKAVLWGILVGFWGFIWKGLFAPHRTKNREFRVLLFALPCLAALVIYLFLHHSFTPPGDELNLFNAATKLDSFAFWFNYPSGYYWIMGIMLIPHEMGPTVIKLLIQALVAGYCLVAQIV